MTNCYTTHSDTHLRECSILTVCWTIGYTQNIFILWHQRVCKTCTTIERERKKRMSLIILVVQFCVTLYDYLLWNAMVTHITKTIRSTSNEAKKSH